ncbi:MAG TPA: hypothetical protein GX699_03625 [Firmicutes bacterium]|nr:hypothetical protein [Bacillota bacterium]
MKKTRFPATHMVLPAFRAVSRQHDKQHDAVTRVQNKQEFQRLIELSLTHGIVLEIVTQAGDRQPPCMHTGIVSQVNPTNGTLTIQTPEGRKILAAAAVCKIRAVE